MNKKRIHIDRIAKSKSVANILAVIKILLISLWAYTASIKLGNMERNLDSMHQQFFPAYVGTILAYLIPTLAILTIILLFYRSKAGFLISIGLLSSFIIFIVLAYSGIFSGQTCACAGIFPSKSYLFHLYFNIVMLGIAGLGLFINNRVTSKTNIIKGLNKYKAQLETKKLKFDDY